MKSYNKSTIDLAEQILATRAINLELFYINDKYSAIIENIDDMEAIAEELATLIDCEMLRKIQVLTAASIKHLNSVNEFIEKAISTNDSYTDDLERIELETYEDVDFYGTNEDLFADREWILSSNFDEEEE